MPKKAIRNRRQRGPSGLSTLKVPPRIEATIRSQHVFRFSANAALSAVPVAGYDLLGLVAMATSATGVTSLLAGVRIRRVELWAPAQAAAQNTLNINWVGNTFQQPKRSVDTAMNSAIPGYTWSTPPPGTDASMWIGYPQRSTTYFTVDGPNATVVDVHVEIVLNNASLLGSAGGTPTYTSSGLTVGSVYFGPLDKNTGSPKMIPVGMSYYG